MSFCAAVLFGIVVFPIHLRAFSQVPKRKQKSQQMGTNEPYCCSCSAWASVWGLQGEGGGWLPT